MVSHSKLWTCAGALAGALIVVPYAIKVAFQHEGQKAGAKHYEFGGPVGAYCTMVGLPGVIFFLYSACGKDFVMPGLRLRSLADMPLPQVDGLISWRALRIVFGWFGFQVLLERCLPGATVEGVDLAAAGGSGRLKYRMNGHVAFWTSLLTAAALRGNLAVLYDEYAALAGASVIFSVGLSVYLYASSFRPSVLLAAGGNTGNPVYDFFIGRELNPRIGSFDLKQFCELRPGLVGWMLLNLGMAAKHYQNTGGVSGSMVLVNVLQALYVWDALWQEQAILTTMDITTDGFGYMLAFGDLAWVPFTYGLQARYLVDHDPGLSSWTLACIAGLGFGGYAIFRAANSQKDVFRRDPADSRVKHLEVLEVSNSQTGKSSQLIVSGWWGLARKINYTGDWLMAICSPCPAPPKNPRLHIMPRFADGRRGHGVWRQVIHFLKEALC